MQGRKHVLRVPTALLLVVAAAVLPPVDCKSSEFPQPGRAQSWICYTTSGGVDTTGGNVHNTTICGQTCGAHSDPLLGYVGALIAVLFFGSNFLPVKKFDTGDGVFFQWVVCIGIWLVGLVVNVVRLQPPFFLPVFFGGMLWTTGNLMVVPIIKMIGLTMGLTIWGSSNLLAGWISGRFILKQENRCQYLNYGGVAVVLFSTFLMAFVKSEGKRIRSASSATEHDPLIASQRSASSSLVGTLRDKLVNSQRSNEAPVSSKNEDRLTFSNRTTSINPVDDDQDASWVDSLGKWPRKFIGLGLSIVSGFFYGFEFLAVEFMRQCDDNSHSCNELDYVFGHYTGIMVMGTFYFILYSLWKQNKPIVYPRVILPAITSGMMWGVAMVGWFLANQHLSLAVSFPVVTAGPGFVSAAWGILLYREIKGWRSIGLYLFAFCVSVCGLAMVGLSSCTIHCSSNHVTTPSVTG